MRHARRRFFEDLKRADLEERVLGAHKRRALRSLPRVALPAPRHGVARRRRHSLTTLPPTGVPLSIAATMPAPSPSLTAATTSRAKWAYRWVVAGSGLHSDRARALRRGTRPKLSARRPGRCSAEM